MAKVEYAPLVSNVSGRMSGMVFSRWQGVQLVRRFSAPANPKSPSQVSQRNAFRNLTETYIRLPNTVRANNVPLPRDLLQQAWRKYAGGRPGIGRNFFIGTLARDRGTINAGHFLPANRILQPPTIALSVSTARALQVTFTLPTLPSTYLANALGCLIFREDTDFTSAAFVPTDVLAGVASPANPARITFTGLTTGQQYHVHAFYSADIGVHTIITPSIEISQDVYENSPAVT